MTYNHSMSCLEFVQSSESPISSVTFTLDSSVTLTNAAQNTILVASICSVGLRVTKCSLHKSFRTLSLVEFLNGSRQVHRYSFRVLSFIRITFVLCGLCYRQYHANIVMLTVNVD